MKKQPFKILSDPLIWPESPYPTEAGTAMIPMLSVPETAAIYGAYGSAESERPPERQNRYVTRGQDPISRQEVGDMIDRKLTELRVYVLESDITQAQRSVKSIVELASF